MKYFENIKTLDELKKAYRRLAMQYHPDCGGNTKANKDKLKAAGCKWSKSKGKWYWHHAEAGSRWYRGKSSMAEIRTKYGSQAFRSRGSQDIETATA